VCHSLGEKLVRITLVSRVWCSQVSFGIEAWDPVQGFSNFKAMLMGAPVLIVLNQLLSTFVFVERLGFQSKDLM
jgi:hypothetical protein